MDKKDLVNVFDYEAAARAKLPKTAYDYYRSGANDELTLHNNHAAYERIKLKPKVLIDTSKRDLTTTVLGQTASMPILVDRAVSSGCTAIALTVDAQVWGRRHHRVKPWGTPT